MALSYYMKDVGFIKFMKKLLSIFNFSKYEMKIATILYPKYVRTSAGNKTVADPGKSTRGANFEILSFRGRGG